MNRRLAPCTSALALLLTACGSTSSFVAMDHFDTPTGVQVFYAPPDRADGVAWRQSGRISVSDASFESDAETQVITQARKHGCEGVYIAQISEYHEVSGFTVVGQLLSLAGNRADRAKANRQADRDMEQPHYRARAVCLTRIAEPRGDRLAVDTPAESVVAATPAPAPATVSMASFEPPAKSAALQALEAKVGRVVRVSSRDGVTYEGKLIGCDAEQVYLQTGRALRRFDTHSVVEVADTEAGATKETRK